MIANMPVDITTKREDPMSTYPTTLADLAAAGWTPGTGRSGYRSHSIEIGPYEIAVYSDGAGVYLERSVDASLIPEADACTLASKIAALLRGEYEIVAAERDTARTEAETLRARLNVETEARRRALSALASALSVDADDNDTDRLVEAANAAASHIKAGTETVNRLDLAVSKLEVDLAKAEARFTEIYADLQQQIKAAHAMFDEADVEGCLGVLADRAKALAVDRGRATNTLEAVTKERDAARADLAKARANNDLLDQVMMETATALGVKPDNEAILEAIHLLQEQHANNPAPANPHDPPTETAAEATVRRLRSYLSKHTGADHTDADIVSAVVSELRSCGETVKALQDRVDRAEKRAARAEDIAQEQLRHRMRGT